MQSLTSLLSHLETNRDSPTISLAYASVGDDGMAEVSRFVRDNSFVKYLDLRGNNIAAKGAVTLSNGLKLNRSLRSLNLKWNQIGRDNTGVQALCEMLRTNVTISHVDFRNNRINNVGATYIGEMLRENTTITHLDVSWNDLGVDGGLALLEGLKHNSVSAAGSCGATPACPLWVRRPCMRWRSSSEEIVQRRPIRLPALVAQTLRYPRLLLNRQMPSLPELLVSLPSDLQTRARRWRTERLLRGPRLQRPAWLWFLEQLEAAPTTTSCSS